MDFAQIILSPFVWLLTFFYNLFDSYGLALILFAIVVKVILFPFSLKGKKGMIQMNMLSGKMQQLQKAYGNNRERYNQEVQALYAREKVNPMSGCLWSFLPLLILLPLYAIIRQPLKYMMGLDATAMFNIANTVDWNSIAVSMGWMKADAVAKAIESTTAAGGIISGFVNNGYNQLYLASLITPENLAAVQKAVGGVLGSKIFAINFDFLGVVNLAAIPTLKFWTVEQGFGLFLLPVISAVTGFLFSWLSMKTNAVNQQSANAAANQSSKMMMFISPLISLWIGFSMPAGLCVYWITNNLLSMLQEVLSGRLLKKDYEKAAAAKAEQERQEKEEEKRRKKEAAEERARRIEESKQNKGKKKPAQKKKPKDEEEDKIPASVKEASRVGMRPYARGRAYDPNRYAVTPYEEGGQAVDGAAVSKALDLKKQEPAGEEREDRLEASAAPEKDVPEEDALEAPYAPDAEDDDDDEEKEGE